MGAAALPLALAGSALAVGASMRQRTSGAEVDEVPEIESLAETLLASGKKAKKAREAQETRTKGRRGHQATLLTGSRGLTSEPPTQRKTLLGY